ncbi:glycosyltransferase family 4 protein [Vibrio parahaemolyticus]|uniref:glycosyltransferase family 4 protein n=1 Tax=Vibrio parahaemolyticus TaxID=670 RepID=UPI000825C76E|nr:glycosyltransferase family 4 protein [Vibrio parahaemolyticus]EGR2781500.1 glycosyltransferase family 1 protein [Vibrio parahaemolyticus]EHH2506031.1 glycosyltransferase family 4 protein [Vibrio parahaemolyticus]EIZ1328120.1 glycosyltransferase family 4 protein [Vibrio parahaemolyticus]EJB5623030.1 glycosyltransferase family 4 protein [Vibrio parahaemolyticus]EJC6730396.1 glycosyltransferase family 4 protein [Vibrio parahaemolyticus]
MKILIIGASPRSLWNFRGKLIEALDRNGLTVTAAANNATSNEIREIKNIGCEYFDYDVTRNGLNPIQDIKTLTSLKKNIRRISPNIVLAYTIKPIIWGGIATRAFNSCSFYAMVTGLGYAFQKGGLTKNLLNTLVRFLYRSALKKSKGVIFQNRDNMQVFIDKRIVPKEKCFLVNGSGVDLSHYNVSHLPPRPHFLLIARLLGDKGIREYAQAAELVKQKYPEAVFELVGPEDPSPDGITLEEIQAWCDKGAIVYSGATNDVRPFIENCSIYVLPSYHEGMPRTVLEAMAMGRPILTTDVPGCRETVIDGENGWLVEKANVEQLTERMIWFIENQEQWQHMAKNSHDMAYEKFDVHKVNAEILRIMGLSNEKDI